MHDAGLNLRLVKHRFDHLWKPAQLIHHRDQDVGYATLHELGLEGGQLVAGNVKITYAVTVLELIPLR